MTGLSDNYMRIGVTNQIAQNQIGYIKIQNVATDMASGILLDHPFDQSDDQ